jgi:cobalt/nickel transport system permease protein
MSIYARIREIDRLELLARGNSPVHRLHPGAKIVALAVYVGALVSFPPSAVSAIVPYVLYPAVLMPLSETPWRILFPRLLGALPFVLLGALSCLAAYRDTAFFLGPLRISAGMVSCVSIFLRAFLAVAGALILIATTSYDKINRQLVRMGMPKILCLQFIMTWRYISVLLREGASMGAAYSLRSGKDRPRMRDMGAFLGSLLIRSFDRAGRVYRAMSCRGFDGVYRGKEGRRFGPPDFLYVVFISAGALGLRFFNLSLFAGRLLGTR